MQDKNTINLLTNFRRRIYLGNNLYEHIIAEILENKALQQSILSDISLNSVKAFANEGKKLPVHEIAKAENINLKELLIERFSYESLYAQRAEPQKVIHIIGAPRSGTTHLFYLMSCQLVFAYFSSISHYLWSFYNFKHEKYRGFLHDLDNTIFDIDNILLKWDLTKIITPCESQEMFNNSIKVQTFLKKRTFEIAKPDVRNIDILKSAIEKHSFLYKKDFFLSKDPFNCFRIEQLNAIYPKKTYFIHINRNGYDVAQSLDAHGMSLYDSQKHQYLLGKDIWINSINKILEHTKSCKVFHVDYDQLNNNPEIILKQIFDWLDIPLQDIRNIPNKKFPHRVKSLSSDKTIDKFNLILSNVNNTF